jgi:hypothetical protein
MLGLSGFKASSPQESNGSYFLDCDTDLLQMIVNYLRTSILPQVVTGSMRRQMDIWGISYTIKKLVALKNFEQDAKQSIQEQEKKLVEFLNCYLEARCLNPIVFEDGIKVNFHSVRVKTMMDIKEAVNGDIHAKFSSAFCLYLEKELKSTAFAPEIFKSLQISGYKFFPSCVHKERDANNYFFLFGLKSEAVNPSNRLIETEPVLSETQ